jgi:RNA-directed DNA polymerase
MKEHVVRSIPISYEMVSSAYGKVKQGGKAAGIDGESWTEFEREDVSQKLYVIWNRLSSGSYFPNAVREVEIPKKDGRMRKLGIPTIRDRIAQQVIKKYMEDRIDGHFHESSYGYRPLKSSKQALEAVRKNCLEQDWVLDMDISNFFDEIDHDLMLRAVEAMLPEKWIRMYVQRWLQMKEIKADGSVVDKEGKGTPQGGVISPLLANLYLHYGLDKWLDKNHPDTKFVRYADDVILHCKDRGQAERLQVAIKGRLQEIGLRLNTVKTKIVYCKDYRRKERHEQVQFGFLGYSYQPRSTRCKFKPRNYTIFSPEISKDNQKRIRDEIKKVINWRNTSQEISQIAGQLNSKLRGWLNYYGLYGKRELREVMIYLEDKLMKWLRRKHLIGTMKSVKLYVSIRKQNPKMFYHWEAGYCYYLSKK